MKRIAGENPGRMTAGRSESGMSLQDFLAARCSVSHRTAKAMIDGRHVWVNRKCVWMAHHTVRSGDVVEVPPVVVSAAAKRKRTAGPAAEPGSRKREVSHIRILLETPDYIVADKPVGISSAEAGTSAESVLREQTGNPSLVAVHRLDRDTSGCLLFAKSRAAFDAAVEIFKTHSVKKTYRAAVAGRFPHSHMTVDAPIDGKRAITHITRDAVSIDASFLKVRIETGRTNQIRRHLASIRFPVLGDRIFGLKKARDPRLISVPRQMLHASSLELPYPMKTSNEPIRAHSPLPADFRRCLKMFGLGKRA